MKKISAILIILGIMIAAVPIVGSIYTNHQQTKLYEEYLNSSEMQNTINEMEDALQSVTPSAVTVSAVSPAVTQIEGEPAYKPTVLGRVKIPSASIDILLVEGSSAKELNWGAGHLTATPMPGEIGNCAIAGHRNYTFGTYFSRLGEVKIGDTVTVEYKKTSYQYEVYEILTVLPYDTSVLGQTDKESILTLITCTPKGSNTHRLILHAKLIS